MNNSRDIDEKLVVRRTGSSVRALAGLVSLIILLPVLFFSGCKKSGGSSSASSGVPTVNVAKLREAFPSPDSDTQKALGDIVFAVRSKKFDAARDLLQALAANSSLTDAQKQAVQTATEQVEKAQAAAAAAKAAQ
jgi:hypothetical protein